MSILFTEYNEEIARRVYGEELLEDRDIEIAKNALREGATAEFVKKITGLAIEIIQRLQKELEEEYIS